MGNVLSYLIRRQNNCCFSNKKKNKTIWVSYSSCVVFSVKVIIQ